MDGSKTALERAFELAKSGKYSSLGELRRNPYPSLAPLAKMKTVISIHDPRVLNVSVTDIIDDQFVRKFDEDGELDALYATHGVV